MKKSELRTIIREVLKEELLKEKKALREQPVLDKPEIQDQEPVLRQHPAMVRKNSYEDVATGLCLDPDFVNLVQTAGSAYDDAVADAIETEVSKKYPSLSPATHNKAVSIITAYVASRVGTAIDDDFSNFEAETAEINRIKAIYANRA